MSNSISVNSNLDDGILKEFRDVIYQKRGLKHGDFKKTLEDAMLEYIVKYSKSSTAKAYAKRAMSEKDSLK